VQTVLSDIDRRTIANLSIPRNVQDLTHTLRTDPNTQTRAEQEVAAHLQELAGFGLVVNLGTHEDPAKLAHEAQRHKHALTMPDEKAKIFSQRLAQPHRRWRMTGDVWMLTDAGLEMLKAPLGSDGSSNLANIERLLAEHAAHVVQAELEGSIFDEDGGKLRTDVHLAKGARAKDGSLVATLLPEEYAHWAKLVSDQAEQDHGVRPQQPLAGGTGYSDATELLILDADGAKTASYAETAPTYMALSILAFTDADTGTTADDASHIPTYTGYARKSIAAADLNSAAAGSRSNANSIVFAACTAGSSTIVGFARCTAATLGRIIRSATCPSTTVSSTQTPAQLAAGAYTDTLD
jgi:hypothetical protein